MLHRQLRTRRFPPDTPRRATALLTLVLLAFACQAPFSGLPSATPEPESTATSTPPAAPSPPGTEPAGDLDVSRVSIRVQDGVGLFYLIESDEAFVPRGVNYVDFYRTERGHYEDRVLATNVYDRDRVRTAFRELSAFGYSTVRIFFDTCGFGPYCIGSATGEGLNPSYLDNMVDLMRIAGEEGLYIIFTANAVPELGGYWSYFDEQVSRVDVREGLEGYQNSDWLHPAGVEIKRRYWQDLMDGMVERNAPFETVLGWQLTNELWLWKNEPPLSLEEGQVTISNGQTYDMSDAGQKRQMVVDGILYYFDQVAPVIRQADPHALVTVGFFAPQFPNPTGIGGEWYVDTAPLIEAENPIDFWDFHAYYDNDLSIREQAQNFGMIDHQEKPVIMGETGSGQAFFPSAHTGLTVGLHWIAESCQVGFDGWLNWGYYPWPDDLDGKPWTFLDQDQLLMRAMAPVNQPDPCQVPELDSLNVALGRPIRYSRQTADAPASAAVDGSGLAWSAGDYPPQWIEIELARPTTVQRVGMSVSQWPPGPTRHQIWAIRGLEPEVLIADIRGFTTVDMSLAYDLPVPLEGVTAVRISTLESPSWAGWREVEVISAPPADAPACVGRLLSPSAARRWPGPDEPAQATLGRGILTYLDGRTVADDGSLWRRLGGGAWLPESELILTGTCNSDLLSSQPLPRTNPVTFHVEVPESTEGEVFMTGSFPGTNLPSWLPWMILLQPSGGTYQVTIELPVDRSIEYVYTRGSWESIERTAACGETKPRALTVPPDPVTIEDQVVKWNDLDGCQ